MNKADTDIMESMIFLLIRHLHSRYSQLMDAAAAVVKPMRASGHTARVVDYSSEKYITVQVDGTDYKIVRTPGWHYYEVHALN